MDEEKNGIPKQQNLFENEKEPKTKDNKVQMNLFDLAVAESGESSLELVRPGRDEIAIIPFTADGEMADLHYCPETEIQSYVVCNGSDCLLCRIGRKLDQRLLLPVYLPAAGCVGILPVSKSLRPFALLPQISNVLKAEKSWVIFLTRDGAKYNVSTVELRQDVDGGEAVIKRFLDEYEVGLHNLLNVYPKIDNKQLANVEKIARMMSLKGIRQDAGNQLS